MTLLQKQTYYTWFQWLGNFAVGIYEKDPKNKHAANIVSASTAIGLYVAQLEQENEMLKLKLIKYQQLNAKNNLK
jgi:hypothetical protein